MHKALVTKSTGRQSQVNISREFNKAMQASGGERNAKVELDVQSLASKLLNRSFNNINVLLPHSQLQQVEK